ncbi:multidrug efflux RND transporter permease subunit [Roseovarius confluentis]|uniref:multidrug efflux RND transporter permease subunit n=1 Tax=Roseovarius confluentis TaxID=1852027 RepID=UPI003BACDD49
MGAFFVHRPVFAWVIAIVTSIVGTFAMISLPVSQYPEIAPTTVRVEATYPGGTASTLESTVTRVIEDRLTGLDGLLYTTSTSTAGSSSITMVFDGSIEPVTAQNDVQVRVTQIESQLPQTVRDQGVNVTRSSSSLLLVGALVSENGAQTSTDLGNIFTGQIESTLLRQDGVGGVNLFGSGYAMRIWLDPLSLARYRLTASDVVSAVEAQNTAVAVGALGDLPLADGQQVTATITAQSQLRTEDEFGRILLRSGLGGDAVYLSDVARIEIGNESYATEAWLDRQSAVGFGVNLRTGANALDTAEGVRELLRSIEPSLPEGVAVEIPYDTSPFVERSINQVYMTLVEAVVLVLIVLLIFLQTWRATIIPIITVPIVLLGTFAALSVLGYTVNTLTMFALVLAIGLLVDDAIVVVENVERLIAEEDLDPVTATVRSMKQITGALIGILVVLVAVFVPMAFSAGSVGVIYRQFSITIITAMVLSLLIALSLTPAMCAQLLRKRGDARFFAARWFNSGLSGLVAGFTGLVKRLVPLRFVMLLVVGAIGYGGYLVYERMPGSFIPTEDQGVVLSLISLPAGTTAPVTEAVLNEVETHFLENEPDAVEAVFGVRGFSFAGSGQHQAMLFARLKDFDLREDPSLSAEAVAARANQALFGHRSAQIFTIQPPAIPGLGTSGGFSMYLLDQGGQGADELIEAAQRLTGAAAQDPRLTAVRADGIDTEASLSLDIDRPKAESFGLSVDSVNAMLSIIFAGRDVNDFLLGNDLRPVIVQADAPHRMQPEDVASWYARNSDQEMVPFSAFIQSRWEQIAPVLTRYDGLGAIAISGNPSQGGSSGDAMAAMEEVVASETPEYGVGWAGISFQERAAGSNVAMLYAISALIVFLALAALYESWMVPLSVMLAVPISLTGALTASWLTGQSNDVYFTVGLLTTIGLASRNAILVVEFAEEVLRETGDIVQAAVTAARQRLRPILMTALTFMLGVMPLATASGPGAQAQNAIGIAVLGGMAASTFVATLFVPLLYVLVKTLAARVSKQAS